MAHGELMSGLSGVRRPSVTEPDGRCGGMFGNLQRIHSAARQLFGGVLAKPMVDPITLEHLLVSLERQISAAWDIQPQVISCRADYGAPAELAGLLQYFETCRNEIAARLGAGQPSPGLPHH